MWTPATVIGPNGVAPWGKLDAADSQSSGGKTVARGFTEASASFDFPSPLLLIRDRTSESSTPGSPQAIGKIGNSRASLEIDTLGPSIAGHRLQLLTRVTAVGAAGYEEAHIVR